MSQYGQRAHTNMDILYLLLPIIGAFLLLFLVCCFGRKVKEMLHIPKELVLGRHFPGMASSSSTTSSSRSSFSDSDSGGEGEEEEPAIVVNMTLERQRVLGQHRRRYTQVPSGEMVFTLQGDLDLHQQQQQEGHQCPQQGQQLVANRHLLFNHHHHYRRLNVRPPFCLQALGKRHIDYRKSQCHRRSDSCPLLSDFNKAGDVMMLPEVTSSYVDAAHASYRMHPYHFRYDFRCQGNSDADSDCDIPSKVVEKPDRKRHRSNSESDIPKRCLELETDSYLAKQRLSQFSHRLSSTEFQLHATEDCTINIQSHQDLCSSNQAEVG